MNFNKAMVMLLAMVFGLGLGNIKAVDVVIFGVTVANPVLWSGNEKIDFDYLVGVCREVENAKDISALDKSEGEIEKAKLSRGTPAQELIFNNVKTIALLGVKAKKFDLSQSEIPVPPSPGSIPVPPSLGDIPVAPPLVAPGKEKYRIPTAADSSTKVAPPKKTPSPKPAVSPGQADIQAELAKKLKGGRVSPVARPSSASPEEILGSESPYELLGVDKNITRFKLEDVYSKKNKSTNDPMLLPKYKAAYDLIKKEKGW